MILQDQMQDQMQKAFKLLELDLELEQQAKFIQHLELLAKWNKIHNLTSIDSIGDMLVLHIFDSLSINRYLQGNRLLDLGSGAGFPGIPLAIAEPTREFILLEKNRKKSTFIQHVINELNLTNVTVVQSRIENFVDKEFFDGLLARAVGGINWIYSIGKRVLKVGNGRFYFMLAKNVDIPSSLRVNATLFNLNVPYLNATRKLLVIKN